MVQHKAHDLEAQPRTEDIQLAEDIDFKSMLLPKPILHGLKKSGYIRPSPIQRKAIPLVRCGMDLIVQAKAGTGKTCVFTLAALELVEPHLPHLQAVMLAPVREIAMQIVEVIEAIGQSISGLKTCCFIGGYPLKEDEKKVQGCHIAVGAPGRMRHLIEKGLLVTRHVRLFVLDEADKLLEKAFVKDINAIFSSLPESKQVLACSATYTPELVDFLSKYMHRGQYVSPQHTSAHTTVLVGVRQLVSLLSFHVDKLATLRAKEKRLLYLLSAVSFNQCLVFSNLHSRAVSVCNMLRREGWSVDWIAGRQEQADRVVALAQLKQQRVRVLITTDLTARGIDVENVNLVINLDLPPDYHTYLHRTGRAGRYGSHGMVITILSAGAELVAFQKLLGAIGGTSQSAAMVPENLKNIDLWTTNDEELGCVYGLIPSAASEESPALESCSGESCEEGLIVETAHRNGNAGLQNTRHESESDSTQSSRSDEEASIENGKEDVDNGNSKEGCSCNLFKVGESDIDVIVEPSIFTVSEKEDHWHDVLPIVVNEFKIPLNSPIALLGSKVVRVKSWTSSNKNDSSVRPECSFNTMVGFDSSINSENPFDATVENNSSIGPENSCDVIIDFNRKTENIPLMSFEEIRERLESNVLNIDDTSNINKHSELLSFVEIQNALDSNAAALQTEGSAICEKLKQVEQLLQKHQVNRTALEDMMSAYDSFDIIGWMATDQTEDMLQLLKADKLNVAQYSLVKCSKGTSHIQVNLFPECVEQNETGFKDQISTLNLEKIVVGPITMQSLAEQLRSSRIQSYLEHHDIKSLKQELRLNRGKIDNNYTKQSSAHENKPSKSYDNTNGRFRHLNETALDRGQRSRKESYNREEMVQLLNSCTKASHFAFMSSSILSHDRKERRREQRKERKKLLLAKHKSTSHLKENKQKRPIPASKQHVDLSERQCDNKSVPKHGVKYNVDKEIASHKCPNGHLISESNESSLLKSGQESESSSSDPSEIVRFHNAVQECNRVLSHSSGDSGPHVDMTQNLKKWQELHDCEESDFSQELDSDCLRVIENFRARDTCSNSSESPFEMSPVKHKCANSKSSKQLKERSGRQSISQRRRNNVDPRESVDSGATNQHSYRTACSQHHSEDVCRPCTGRPSADHCQPSHALHHHKFPVRERLDSYQSHRSTSNVAHKLSTHDASSVFHSYQEGYTSHVENQRERLLSQRRLRSDNLFSDWYSTWYSQIRQRAEEIAKVEYSNSMSKP